MAECEDRNREYYLRLLSFFIGPATDTLHLYFETKVLNSSSFGCFLEKHKHLLYHELLSSIPCCECKSHHRKKGHLTDAQFNLLFEKDVGHEIQGHKKTKGHQIEQFCLCSISAKPSITSDVMDITLLSAVITTCCPSGTISGHPSWISDLKTTRNYIMHCPNGKITETEYYQKFSIIEKSVLNLASAIGSAGLNIVKSQISYFKKSEFSTIKDIVKNSNDSIHKILKSFVEEQNCTLESLVDQTKNLTQNIETLKTGVFSKLQELKVFDRDMEFVIKPVIQSELLKATVSTKKDISIDHGICYVEWTLATPCNWDIDKIKDKLKNVSELMDFRLVFVFKGSLVIQTTAPILFLQNGILFQEAVASFLKELVVICDLNVQVKTIVNLELVVSKENFASKYLAPKKMETSRFVCGPCSSKKVSTEAIQYCWECQNNLCQQCLKKHNFNAAFLQHNMTTTGTLFFENICTKHESLTLDFFCVEHDCLCCQACITSEHSCCQKLVPLEDAAKDVQHSVIFQDISYALSSIAKTLDKAITNQDENIKSLDSYDKVAIFNEVTSHKTGIINRLDELRDKIMQDSYCLKEEQKFESVSSKNKLLQIAKPIKHMSDQVNIVFKYGSQNQLFVLLNRYKLEISDYENKLKAILPTLKTRRLTFHPPGNIINTFISLGSTRLTSTQYNAEYKLPRMQQVQAPLLDTSIQMTSNFTLHSKIEIKRPGGVWISSIGITDDNCLLLCNFYGRNILLYSEKGDYLHDCKLSGEPWDIAVLSGEDKSVTTQPHQHSIQFINTKTMKPGSTHSVPGDCYAIAVVNDKICVGGHQGYLYIVDKQGQHITTVRVANAGSIDYLHSGPHDTVYYIDSNHMAVTCVNLEGHRRFRYTPKDLKSIRSVITDKEGNMYLAGNSSYNIQRLTPNGKFLDVILDEGNFMKNPIDMVFSNDCRKLFVLNQDKNNTYVLVFSCL